MIRWLDGTALRCVLPSDTAEKDKDKTVFTGTPMNREASNLADQVMKKRLLAFKNSAGSEDPKKIAEEVTRIECDQLTECIDNVTNGPGGATRTKKAEIRACLFNLVNSDFNFLYRFFIEGSGLAILERKS